MKRVFLISFVVSFCVTMTLANVMRMPQRWQLMLNVGGADGWVDTKAQEVRLDFEQTNSTSSLDASGNSHNATNKPSIAAGPTWIIVGTNENGRVEHAYDFDNSDDHFNLGTPAELTDMHATNFIVTMWVYWEGVSSGIDMLITKNPATTTGWWWSLSNAGGTDRFRAETYYDGTDASEQCTINGVRDKWLHWTMMIYDRQMVVYTNGVLVTPDVEDTPGVGAASTDAGVPLRIGARSDGFNFNGQIDDVRIYINGRMSTNEMLAIVANTMPTNNLEFRP